MYILEYSAYSVPFKECISYIHYIKGGYAANARLTDKCYPESSNKLRGGEGVVEWEGLWRGMLGRRRATSVPRTMLHTRIVLRDIVQVSVVTVAWSFELSTFSSSSELPPRWEAVNEALAGAKLSRSLVRHLVLQANSSPHVGSRYSAMHQWIKCES